MLKSLAPKPIKKLYWRALGYMNRPRFPQCFGDVFARQWNFLQKSARWSDAQINSWQDAQLAEILHIAWNHCPFYRRCYEGAGVDISRVRSARDLAQLPIITKADLRAAASDMVNSSIASDRLQYHNTSGSTAQPVDLWRIKDHDMFIDWAFIYRQWAQAGWRFGDAVVRVRGMVSKQTDGGEITRRLLWPENITSLAAAEVAVENYDKIMAVIREVKPKFLEMYPSALHSLSAMIAAHGDSVEPVRAIFCESEMITPANRQLAKNVWGAEIFGGYGNSERSVDAVQCDRHSGYHVNYEYAIVELIDDDGRVITEPFVEGDIVTTSLINTSMPMVRFNTADRGCWADGPCPCGRRGQRLAKILGRRQDFLVSRDGRVIFMAMINHFKNAGAVNQYQFRQSTPGEVEFAYTASGPVNTAELTGELKKIFGVDINLSCREVKNFELTTNSKHRMVVQSINADDYLTKTHKDAGK